MFVKKGIQISLEFRHDNDESVTILYFKSIIINKIIPNDISFKILLYT